MLPESFVKRFSLVDSVSETVKTIVGQQPYKQRLGEMPLAVDGTESAVEIYRRTGNIPFLVANWIKVPDSLEMLFNLLFGQTWSLTALSCYDSKVYPPWSLLTSYGKMQRLRTLTVQIARGRVSIRRLSAIS